MRTSPQNKQVLPKFFRRNIVSLQNRQAAPVYSRTQSHLYRIGKLQHFILARRAFASLYDMLLHARSLPVLPTSGSALQPAGQLYFLLKRSAGTMTDIFPKADTEYGSSQAPAVRNTVPPTYSHSESPPISRCAIRHPPESAPNFPIKGCRSDCPFRKE